MVVDPLGRLVAKVKQTIAGETARVYVHDGDQVVAEYAQEAGGTGFILDRRHHWGRWIDDLAVEEVDTDHDGVLDTTLYPVTDLLGSVQLVTDESGLIAERVEYDADGTPHVFTADITPPTVMRLAWTGDGNRPTGDQVTPGVLEVGFDEWIDEDSVATATATVTPLGGTPVNVTIDLASGERAATLTGASVNPGPQYSLALAGLRDRAGNALSTTITFNIADTDTYEVVYDTSPPQILAVMDADDGIYVLTDEPVVPSEGTDLAAALDVKRAGALVPGTAVRVSATLLEWTPDDPFTWLTYSDYQLTAANLEDFTGRPMATGDLPVDFTHLVPEGETSTLVAYQASTDTQPASASAFGIKNLFQGREWHGDLGLYYYRARWYSPGVSSFLERDPFGYNDSPNTWNFLGQNPYGVTDPLGLNVVPEPEPPKPLFPWLDDEPEVPELPVIPSGPLALGPPRGPGLYPSRGRSREGAGRLTKRMAGDLEQFIQNFGKKTTSSDVRKAVSFALDMAEKYDGSSGMSVEGLGGVLVWGIHGGVNVQVFHRPSGRYSIGLYGLETVSDAIDAGFAPFTTGVIGLGAGISATVNIAHAWSTAANAPESWAGHFYTLSGSVAIPIFPILGVGGSIFWSDDFLGVEGAIGPGTPWTAAWSKPYYHILLKIENVDRETVLAIYSIVLQQVSR